MKYSIVFTTVLFRTTKSFVRTAPFSRGIAPLPTTRFGSTWFRPQLTNQRALSFHDQRRSMEIKMNFVSDIFYDLRSQSLGFASKDEVKAAAASPNTVFLDVRSQAEIASSSLDTNKPVIHATCSSADACPALNQLPKDKHAPVIVFCASGKRASGAKQVLESKGYTNVLNAGGLGDLDYL